MTPNCICVPHSPSGGMMGAQMGPMMGRGAAPGGGQQKPAPGKPGKKVEYYFERDPILGDVTIKISGCIRV